MRISSSSSENCSWIASIRSCSATSWSGRRPESIHPPCSKFVDQFAQFHAGSAGLRGHVEANHHLEEPFQIAGLIELIPILPQPLEQASEDRLAHVRRADVAAKRT